jgi:hypothetical protein
MDLFEDENQKYNEVNSASKLPLVTNVLFIGEKKWRRNPL